MHQFFDSTDLGHWPLLFLFLFLCWRGYFNFMLFIFKGMKKKRAIFKGITNITKFNVELHLMDTVILSKFFLFLCLEILQQILLLI